MENYPSLFFSDGKRSIDFVMVYRESKMTDQNKQKLEYFLNSILRTGLHFEIEPFTENNDIIFVKLHGPKDVIVRYSDICDIDLSFRSKDYRPTIPPQFRFLATPLTMPNPEDEVYKRAPESVSGQLPSNITSAEKIMVLHKILTRTKFGTENCDYGIVKLLSSGVFIDSFPLHDGPSEWTTTGTLTDRQLLLKFWASARCWYKEQPLKLIEKYYGTEVGFFFAWCGFYQKMMIPAAIMSLICVAYGLFTMFNPAMNIESGEVCHSDMIMCPRCHYERCKYERLADSCIYSYVSYLHDNRATIAFAIIISFWSTIFIEMWQRNESVLQIHWNVKSLEHDTSMRVEYAEAADHKKFSPITGGYEPYISKKYKIARYTLALGSVVLLLTIMIFATFGVMVYRTAVSLLLIRDRRDTIINHYNHIIASTTGSIISVTIIVTFKTFYSKIAMWLTSIENPRTQYEFDNSYIYKNYALAFTNFYSVVFYIAFVKGRFFTHPGDMTLWANFGGLGSDICDPTGCIMDLSIQLMSIMFIKIFISNFNQLIVPIMLGYLRRYMHWIHRTDLPIYGTEYLKPPTTQYFLVDEYLDMVIQYGFIVLFVAGFPPAPFFALLNSLVELRVDAYKITTSFRRPIPRKVTGLGAWLGILQAITYVGVVTNALVIAFTSDFVSKALYRAQVHSSLKGFINTTLSSFASVDFAILRAGVLHPDVCYYPGKRFPYNHPQKYEPTTDYWYTLAIRFLVVVVFEHVIICLKSILAYAIPDIPQHVTEELAIEERKNKEARMKVINDEFLARLKGFGFSATAKPLDIN